MYNVGLILVILFFVLLFMGIPISFTIAFSSFVIMLLMLPNPDFSMITAAQVLATGINNSALIAIPFFIFSGCIMNSSGLALRLINFAKLFSFFFRGPLLFINIIANMLFGAISGSATAAAVAVGKIVFPLEQQENYDKSLSASVNILSCPTGLLIPPSNSLIVYALVSGGASISALFWAGYLPGIIMGISVMIVSGIFASKYKYPRSKFPGFKIALKIIWQAIPILLLIFIIIGGITKGIFSPIEASGVAVFYSIILAIIYKSLTLNGFLEIIKETIILSSIVLFLIACSSLMSWALAYSNLPKTVASSILALSHSKVIILILINIMLLIIGCFMDMTPAILIFTPIFLPIIKELGIHPVHFGIIMVYNLCIGLMTPPVGTALFVGCSVSNASIESVSKRMIPFFIVLFISLMLVTFIPSISLFLPKILKLI